MFFLFVIINFFGHVTDLPDYTASSLTCASLPVVPAWSRLVDDFNGFRICDGTVVNYTCNAGGINAFRVLDRVSEYLEKQQL